MTPREFLVTAGLVLFGDEWQRAISRALGRHHPEGPRDYIDDRLVRRWVSGERPVPEWVAGAVASIARTEIAGLRERRAALRELMVLAADVVSPGPLAGQLESLRARGFRLVPEHEVRTAGAKSNCYSIGPYDPVRHQEPAAAWRFGTPSQALLFSEETDRDGYCEFLYDESGMKVLNTHRLDRIARADVESEAR